MKRIPMFLAISAMMVIIGCKQKGQPAAADSTDPVAAAIDSIVEENDTTPLPMFLIGGDGKYMHMLYWTNIEEPRKTDEYAEYFDAWHRSWELQDMFRRNAVQYTNLLTEEGSVKVKFIDEVLKDPDGNTPSIGEIHSMPGIPSLCARFEYVNPKDKTPKDNDFFGNSWGLVIATDSYLNSRKRLDVNMCAEDNKVHRLSADLVGQLEKEYGMEVLNSLKISTIGNRYVHGTVEFKGEYKNVPRDENNKDHKYALALELIIDGDKIYKLEQLGYYDEQWGATWNADADGYISNNIVAAFEGPKGLELCYTHGAPESFAVGMLFPREDKLVEQEYEIFHSMVDEEYPIWKSDLDELDRMYHADERGDKDVKLTKWAHCYVDYQNEWIWLRDKDDKNGAFFIRKDGRFTLVAIENPTLQPSRCDKDGMYYLKLAGPAGGPSWQQEILAFKGGNLTETFFVLEVEGEIDRCELNGKALSKEAGRVYLDRVPEGKEITAFFRDIQ